MKSISKAKREAVGRRGKKGVQSSEGKHKDRTYTLLLISHDMDGILVYHAHNDNIKIQWTALDFIQCTKRSQHFRNKAAIDFPSVCP